MFLGKTGRKVKCRLCGKEIENISSTLSVCLSCIRNNPKKALHIIGEVHKKIREEFALVSEPPNDQDGIQCNICANECKIGSGKKG